MSARRAGPPPGGGTAELVLSLVVIVAALLGGLAAAGIVHTSVLKTLVACVVVAAIAIFALFRWPTKPAELPAAEQRREPVQRGGATNPRPVPPPVPPQPELDGDAGTNTVVQLLPAQSEQAGVSDWWKHGPVPPPAPSAGSRRAPAPDLSTYLAFTQIAQCPNCGAFGLEIGRIRGGWGFRCDSCSYTWAWRPGTPWPPIRVAPGRRRESHPPS